MDRFVKYEKLSKKEKRKIDLAKRGSWGNVRPATSVTVSKKKYKRTDNHTALRNVD